MNHPDADLVTVLKAQLTEAAERERWLREQLEMAQEQVRLLTINSPPARLIHSPVAPLTASNDDIPPQSYGPGTLREARAAFESTFLAHKLENCCGNVSMLAEELGIDRSSLYRKLKGYGIKAD